MYECFHCCTKGVVWDADFDFDDLGYEYDIDGVIVTEGIVHICHCVNCGREIEYRIPILPTKEDSEDDDE